MPFREVGSCTFLTLINAAASEQYLRSPPPSQTGGVQGREPKEINEITCRKINYSQ